MAIRTEDYGTHSICMASQDGEGRIGRGCRARDGFDLYGIERLAIDGVRVFRVSADGLAAAASRNGACQVETSFGVCKPDSTTNANKKCSTDADCDGTSGSCVTEQPFQLDGVVTCP